MRRLTAAVIGAAALLLTVDIPLDSPATAAPTAAPVRTPAYGGPVFEGRGWDLANEHGLRSLNPQQRVRIVFASPSARDLTTPYLEPAAAQVADITGTTIHVTDTVVDDDGEGCPARGTILVELENQPLGKPGFSWGGVCHDTVTRAWHSGHIKIATGWFNGHYPPEDDDRAIRNGVAHELGHAFGLDHPNTDLDGDGKTADHECPRTAAGRLPLMCSPNNGQPGGQPAGRYTPMDAAGLHALVNNHTTGSLP